MVRKIISRKTMNTAVMTQETAYRARFSRQVRGSKGVSSEPSVKTAARSRVSTTPATTRRRRWLEVVEVMTMRPATGDQPPVSRALDSRAGSASRGPLEIEARQIAEIAARDK